MKSSLEIQEGSTSGNVIVNVCSESPQIPENHMNNKASAVVPMLQVGNALVQQPEECFYGHNYPSTA